MTEFKLPIFPLGITLLPSQLLPLQVFEPRFVEMFSAESLERQPAFGVVLIERGSEVGGGEARSHTGCTASVLEIHREADGKAALLAVGGERFVVQSWLDDDPYPSAVVEAQPDTPDSPLTTADLVDIQSEAISIASLACELGGPPLPLDLQLSDDPTERLWQICLMAPIGALDRYKLLTIIELSERKEHLESLLNFQREVLEARLL